MEEKKLTDEVVVAKNAITDEEIAKAILQSIEYSKTITYFDEWGNCKSIFMTDIIDFIHRLQDEKQKVVQDYYCEAQHCDVQKDIIEKQKAEIERLTEELDLANETIDHNNKRYEKVSIERQKALDRVDYLEDALLEKIRRNEELITVIKQAEQQAVKDTAKEICEMIDGSCISSKGYLCSIISKRYGVEVE